MFERLKFLDKLGGWRIEVIIDNLVNRAILKHCLNPNEISIHALLLPLVHRHLEAILKHFLVHFLLPTDCSIG